MLQVWKNAVHNYDKLEKLPWWLLPVFFFLFILRNSKFNILGIVADFFATKQKYLDFIGVTIRTVVNWRKGLCETRNQIKVNKL